MNTLQITRSVRGSGLNRSTHKKLVILKLIRSNQRIKRQHGPTTVQAFLDTSVGAPSSAQMITQLATFIAWGSVAFMGLQLKFQQDSYDETKNRKECDTCEGTGKVDCMCTRWSDGDIGCSVCRGSGKMACHSCGGGGTAVPIEAKVYIKKEKEYY